MLRGISSLLVVVVLLLSGVGCDSWPGLKVNLGDEFSLSLNEQAELMGENLRIRFEEVSEDSRCPKDVTCIWEGRVRCVVVLAQGDSRDRVELVEPGLSDQYARKVYGDYQIDFHIEPYPEAGEQIAEEEYRLVLIVNKL